MQSIRIFFTKTGEAAYISHLDLQRVMARGLRRGGLPVWYSQGFNPHIYMSFALPLPLGHQSLCEAVDCKTEAEDADFSRYIQPLSAALPRGIEVTAITTPVHGAGEIALAAYRISHPDAARLAQAVAAYNAAPTAEVTRKTKRSQQQVDLKAFLPAIIMEDPAAGYFEVTLPAGGESHCNPALLAGFLAEHCGLPETPADILRIGVFLGDGRAFE